MKLLKKDKTEKRNEEKTINRNIMIKILLLLSLIVLGIVSSYSWFADTSNPTVTGSQVKVTAADGLVIKLTPDSEGRTSVSLNNIFTNFDEFELKQVSSVDAENFFKIDFGQGLASGNPEFVKLDTDNIDMVEYGFINYTFYLQTEEYAKHVYIHKDTSITGPATDALRYSLKVKDINGTSSNVIIGDKEENAAVGYETKAVIREGKFDYANIDPNLVTDQLVRVKESRDGGRTNDDTDAIDLNKILVTIPANTQVEMNLKIWLEGGDPDCDNSLSSTNLEVFLKFGSANKLRNAPVLTGNAYNFTITGLTTNMEYATTNTKETIWTPVTSSTQQFSGLKTMYVRYKEIPGVEPASYATKINF